MAVGTGRKSAELVGLPGEDAAEPHAISVTYKDGLKATVLKIGTSSIRWQFACRLKGDPEIRSTRFVASPWNNRNLFKALSHAVQQHFVEHKAPYPIERTLLTTGVLEAAMRSRRDGAELATPELEFGYEPRDFRSLRETGASWQIITEDIPEPEGLDLSGANQAT